MAGSLQLAKAGTTVKVTLVHGNEKQDSETVRELVLGANNGRPVSLTTSWYSALSHIPGRERRASFFRMLADATDPRGELLVAASVSGDLVDLQKCWRERLAAGDVGGHPIEADGDVIYPTELSQDNFYHLFGTDLGDLLRASTGPGQRAWLQAIRLPDDEFGSRDDEQDNYRRTQKFNQQIADRLWEPGDYREVHTAAAIRSGSPTVDER